MTAPAPLQTLARVALETPHARGRAAVRPSDAMSDPHDQSHRPDPVRSLTPSQRVNRGAFRRLVVRATAYAADVPTYGAIHARLRRVRGSAAGLPCFRCGRRSTGWACIASDGDRVTGTNSERRRVSYSLDLADYSPACDLCRAATDAEHAAERRAVVGLALTPLRNPERTARARPEPADKPEPLFALDAADPTGWSHA